MKVVASKDDGQVSVNYRNRFEYCILLIPVIGIFAAALCGFFQKAMRRVLNVCAFKFISYMFGGLLVFLFIQYNLLVNTLGILVLFGILSLLWIIVPMYCVYILVFYLDEIKLKDLIALGYELEPEVELSNNNIYLLK